VLRRSFLGPAFVHTALETDPPAQVSAAGRTLSFLANVDPEDVSRALKGKNPETTLVIVVSKTFTTAETMLNARTVRQWITQALGPEAVRAHMVAVSTNLEAVAAFGLDPNNAFGFWDWVGGRYSVTSAVGMLPLALQYGFPLVERFLAGARSVDRHFASAPLKDNLPVLMGLLGVWNTTFLGCSAVAILPYCQALSKLAPHIQQVSMESNGKGVALDGTPLPFEAGEIIFGEPGTNGQHSFYQLIHQGRLVPCEFVGAAVGQQAVYLDGEVVSNHDELMSNYFAQADALAYGKTAAELAAEGVPPSLIPHKTFSGNRPSLSVLLPTVGAYQVGQMLSLYEHKVAVQGFVWGINSFDQWGVELGKVLAGKVRATLSSVRKDGRPAAEVLAATGFNYSTTRLMATYLDNIQKQKEGLTYSDVFKAPFDGFCTDGEDCNVYGDKN
jgi:glucose-6-phosphate isomerase